MEKKLRILILDDEKPSAVLIENALNSAGLAFISQTAKTKESFVKGLKDFNPDIILAEKKLPSFDGLDALEIAKETCPEVPFVFVTKAADAEWAVETLKKGAADYVIKDHLQRLIPVIKRALKEVENKRKENASQKKLQSIREYYKNIISSSLDMIITVDNERRIIEFNEAAQNIFGYSPSEIIGKPVDILYNNPKEGMKIHNSTIANGACVDIVENKTQSGRIFMSFISSSVLKDSRGKIIGLMGISRDITESRQKEEALKRSESQQKAILNNIPDMAWMKDKDGRFLAANEQFCKSCGIEMKNLIGKTDLDVWPKELAEKYRADDREVMTSMKMKAVEEPLAANEGKIQWIHTIKTPIFNEKGKVIGTTGIARDITDRRHTEEKVKQSEEKYRTLFETMAQGVIYQSASGKIISANPAAARMLGITQSHMIGKTSEHPQWKTIHEDGLEFPDEAHPSIVALKTGKEVKNVIMGVFNPVEKKYRWLEISSVPQFNAGEEKPYQVYTTIADITERRHNEEKIKGAESRFRELFENMSNGVSIYEAAEDGRDFIFKEFNRSAEKIEKIKREDVIGRSVTDVFPGVKKCGIFDVIKRVWKTGVPEQVPEIFYVDNRINGSRENYIYKLASGEVAAIYEDTTKRRQAEEALKRNYDTQGAIKSLLSMSLEDITLDEFLALTLNMLFSLERFSFEKRGAIFLVGDVPEVLVMRVHKGISEPLLKTCSKIPFGRCLCGKAAATKKIQFAGSIDDRHETRYEGITPHGHYCVPILSFGRVLGAINLYLKEGYKKSNEDDDFLTAIANTLAGVIERKQGEEKLQKSFDQLRRTLEETASALSSALEKRDQYTAGHQNRVSQLACAIAKEMGLSEFQIEGLRIAGILHDIGKLYIPSEILSKPGKLTDLEFQFMQTHAQASYDILKDIEFPWLIAQMVFQHHERINGSGYPGKLLEEKILPEAKILAVADTVEAMASHRPYRPALGIDKALFEIIQHKGKKYDPVVVDACVKVFKKNKFNFR